VLVIGTQAKGRMEILCHGAQMAHSVAFRAIAPAVSVRHELEVMRLTMSGTKANWLIGIGLLLPILFAVLMALPVGDIPIPPLATLSLLGSGWVVCSIGLWRKKTTMRAKIVWILLAGVVVVLEVAIIALCYVVFFGLPDHR
jgi:hypothetical protein